MSHITFSVLKKSKSLSVVSKSLKLCFPLMLRTIIYIHFNMRLDFPITFKNASVLFQSECALLHQTVNMVV